MTRSRKTAREAGTPTLAERLWGRVEVTDELCWEWQGYRRNNYGQISIGRILYGTHRLAWVIANDSGIPPGQVVRHACDNPPCCNPDHLLLGSYADNAADAVSRGRIARGLSLPHTRLTDEQVRDVRRRAIVRPAGSRQYVLNRDALAEEFGVQPKYITELVGGRERSNVA